VDAHQVALQRVPGKASVLIGERRRRPVDDVAVIERDPEAELDMRVGIEAAERRGVGVGGSGISARKVLWSSPVRT
jgi:hypothetical protein